MNIIFKKIDEVNDIDLYLEMKVGFMKSFVPLANELGINDKVCENYDKAEAYKDILEKSLVIGRHNGFIECDGKIVGLCDYSDRVSDYLNKNVIYVNNLYILETYRNRGIGTEVLKLLKEKYGFIELQCFYNNLAHDFYRKLGFQREFTQYFL